MAAGLRLVRESFGIELRRGTFQILVDGRDVGSIEAHQTAEVPIEAGSHTVQLRAGRYCSRPHAIDVADDETVTFHCNGARIWPLYLASIVKPNLALSLKRQKR